jgi:hypothetical protein
MARPTAGPEVAQTHKVEGLRQRTWRCGDAAVEDELGEGGVQEGAGGEALCVDEVGRRRAQLGEASARAEENECWTNGGRAAAARAGGGADELEQRAAAREGEGLGFNLGASVVNLWRGKKETWWLYRSS